MKRKKTLKTEVDEQKVVNTFIPPVSRKKTNRPTVIFLHDRESGRKEIYDLAERVAQEGIVGLTLDFRGHGDSGGDKDKQTIRDGLKDVMAGYQLMKDEKAVNLDRIGVFGRGFGGYLAVLLTKKIDVKSLALASPALYQDEWKDLMYRNFPLRDVNVFETKINYNEIGSVQAIKDFSGPVLVMGGDKDTVIPRESIEVYYDKAESASKKDFKFFEVENFQDSEEMEEVREEMKEMVAKWFSKTL